jgi:hypothetical protein
MRDFLKNLGNALLKFTVNFVFSWWRKRQDKKKKEG